MKRVAGYLGLWLAVFSSVSWAQQVSVTGRIELVYGATAKKNRIALRSVQHQAAFSAAVWLTPVTAIANFSAASPANNLRLVQKNKTFQPHLLVVPVGAAVEFPNRDPWFHNVFSLFEGKRFDLGLYEAGESRVVHFDREGISYIFCNIHPEMSAVVIALSTPYYAIVGRGGLFTLSGVPPGRYILHAWSEQAAPETLQAMQREIVVSDQACSAGTIRLPQTAPPLAAHKNKYGRDYDQPAHSDAESPY